jgi:hypothetical protein
MITRVPPGVDCRLKQYRREVFLNFYEFHLRYKAHPGGVYHYMPYLRENLVWDAEQALWYAFINGNTQHPMTSLLIFNAAPRPKYSERAIDFWRANYTRLAFDTDRRYHKKAFPQAVRSLMYLSDGDIISYFYGSAGDGWPGVWQACRDIHTFGRLSAFSFAEYLRIMGVPFDCEDLLVGDSGSTSHRNGLSIVSGNEQWDSHKSNPYFPGEYTPEMIAYLEDVGIDLLSEAKLRAPNWRDVDPYEVSYFTLESTLCTYKGWHRVNRRYPNVYNDMAYDRLKLAEERWPEEDFSIFWEARRAYLPPHLRLEDSPGDPGLTAEKQNHYRLTGRPIMMHKDFPEYENAFNTMVDMCAWGTFR